MTTMRTVHTSDGEGGDRAARMAPIAVALLLVASLGATVAWLALNADDTIGQRLAAIPSIIVPVTHPPPAATASPPADAGQQQAAQGAETGTAEAPPAAQASAPSTGAPPPPLADVAIPPRTVHQPLPPAPPPPPAPADTAPPAPAATLLAAAPASGMIEEAPIGPLPRIAADGRRAWQIYARPFDAGETRPRIAIVVTDLGLSDQMTDAAIARLPGPVTLAFAPYAQKLGPWIERARHDGHEVLLTVPMEPLGYPRDDPGPNTLLTSMSAAQNVDRLNWALSRASGYVGVTGTTGSRFPASADSLRPILDQLNHRGLLYLDSRVAEHGAAGAIAVELGLPRAFSNGTIDQVASRPAIDAQLAELETVARRDGAAVGIASPYPVTFERLAAWASHLADRGFVLAPLSAVVDRQKEG